MPSEVLVDAHCHLDCFSQEKLETLPEGILPVTSGYSHKSNLKNVEIAKKLNISQAAVSHFEKNAIRKIKEAEQTLETAKKLGLVKK